MTLLCTDPTPRSTTGSVCRMLRSVLLLLAAALLLGGCARDYVSGRPKLSFIGEEKEIAMGKEYDEQVVATYGLYEEPELAAYIEEIGQSLAAVSQRPDLKYHFRVLDDGVVNAFALPGGYIYMPRGILAYFNSEDQLAGVVGHETGHVVARHSVEQMSQRVLFTGFGLTDRLAQRFPVIGGLATAPINLGLLKYSRDQESESDRLGVEYTTRIGLDAHAMADFFHTLGAMSAGAGNSVPTYLSSHPHPEDRFQRVNQLADEWQGKLGYTRDSSKPDDYLDRIEGIVYGQDPRRGFTRDGIFYHPTIEFQFPVPPKWKLANSASFVLIVAPEEKAVVQVSLAGENSPATAADAFLAQNKLEVRSRRDMKVNGLATVAVEATHVDGRERTHVLAHFVKCGQQVMTFLGLVGQQDYPALEDALKGIFGGVATVEDRDILEIEPLRVRVVQSPVAGDLETVFRKLHVEEDMLQEMANMNGLELKDNVAKGRRLKVVR